VHVRRRGQERRGQPGGRHGCWRGVRVEGLQPRLAAKRGALVGLDGNDVWHGCELPQAGATTSPGRLPRRALCVVFPPQPVSNPTSRG